MEAALPFKSAIGDWLWSAVERQQSRLSTIDDRLDIEDAEGDPEPQLLMHRYRWKEVKGFFKDHIREFEHCLIES